MKSNETPAIFGTIKMLSEEQKQVINNYVREEYGKANVAIWAVHADETERAKLNSRVLEARRSGDWSRFEVETAKGQAKVSVDHDGGCDSGAKYESDRPSADSGTRGSDSTIPTVDNDLPFVATIKSALNEEIERRLAAMRQKIRDELLSGLTDTLRQG